MARYTATGGFPKPRAVVERYREVIVRMMEDGLSNAKIAMFLEENCGIQVTPQWLGKILAELGWPDPRRARRRARDSKIASSMENPAASVPEYLKPPLAGSQLEEFSNAEKEELRKRRQKYGCIPEKSAPAEK